MYCIFIFWHRTGAMIWFLQHSFPVKQHYQYMTIWHNTIVIRMRQTRIVITLWDDTSDCVTQDLVKSRMDCRVHVCNRHTLTMYQFLLSFKHGIIMMSQEGNVWGHQVLLPGIRQVFITCTVKLEGQMFPTGFAWLPADFIHAGCSGI